MEIELYLPSDMTNDEIYLLYEFIAQKNIKRLIPNLVTKQADKETLGLDEYLPYIKIFLESTAIKAVFDIMKAYIELKKENVKSNASLEREKSKPM